MDKKEIRTIFHLFSERRYYWYVTIEQYVQMLEKGYVEEVKVYFWICYNSGIYALEGNNFKSLNLDVLHTTIN